ncbi:MAG: tRNA threonylcarbamoyladenosine dehydratase [Clostridia bacterium]|nr:tRNA threonylcarbamoyladenosine dehydratase [Clostridia bacterium]
MIDERFSRTARLLGENAMERLARAHILLFGVGGVGGYVCEALVRSGVGEITLVDPDTVAPSNINRQIIATEATLGLPKVEAAAERILQINPACTVHTRQEFYLPESADSYDFSAYDYAIDAIDTVTAKLDIICRCKEAGTPVISAMGTGNKTDPTGFLITDISKTNTCPLASVMRRELRKRGVNHCKVVYSPVPPKKPLPDPAGGRKQAPASIAFVPPVCGLYIAAEVVRELTEGLLPEGAGEETP